MDALEYFLEVNGEIQLLHATFAAVGNVFASKQNGETRRLFSDFFLCQEQNHTTLTELGAYAFTFFFKLSGTTGEML